MKASDSSKAIDTGKQLKRKNGVRRTTSKPITFPHFEFESSYIDQGEVERQLRCFNLEPARAIVIKPLKMLLAQFENDEMVAYRLGDKATVGSAVACGEAESLCLAMNRADAREILVVSDRLEEYPQAEEQVVLSVLHELRHLQGTTDEAEAEDQAFAQYNAELPGRIWRDCDWSR